MSFTPLQTSDNGAVSRTVINDNFVDAQSQIDTLVVAGAPLATTIIKGRVKLSTAPADANEPIAVGDNDTRLVVQSGLINLWPTSTAPSGWLFCRGQAVSRTTYAALFAVLSTTYGVGDGSTTFNLPNLQGRVPVGFDSAQTEFDALGETGGAKTHTLTVAEMPAHTHTNTEGIVTSTSPQASTQSGTGRGFSSSVATSSEGSGAAHNNLQPYMVLNYIIKT